MLLGKRHNCDAGHINKTGLAIKAFDIYIHAVKQTPMKPYTKQDPSVKSMSSAFCWQSLPFLSKTGYLVPAVTSLKSPVRLPNHYCQTNHYHEALEIKLAQDVFSILCDAMNCIFHPVQCYVPKSTGHLNMHIAFST